MVTGGKNDSYMLTGRINRAFVFTVFNLRTIEQQKVLCDKTK